MPKASCLHAFFEKAPQKALMVLKDDVELALSVKTIEPLFSSPDQLLRANVLAQALQTFSAWLKKAGVLRKCAQGETLQLSQADCTDLMKLSNLESLETAYGQSHEYTAKFGGFHDKFVKPAAITVYDSLVLAPMTTLNALVGKAMETMQPLFKLQPAQITESLKDVNFGTFMKAMDEACWDAGQYEALEGLLGGSPNTNLRKKANAMHLMCMWTKQVCCFLSLERTTTEEKCLDIVHQVVMLSSSLDQWFQGNKEEVDTIFGAQVPATEPMTSDQVAIFMDLAWAVSVHCRAALGVQVMNKVKQVAEKRPSKSVLFSEEIMTVTSLQASILENPHHKELVQALLELMDVHTSISNGRTLLLFDDTWKRLDGEVTMGKIAVGTEYGLRKLFEMRRMENAEDKRKMSKDSLNTIKRKAVKLPQFLLNALKGK